MNYTIHVVTKIPDPTTDSGNLAAPILYPDRESRIMSLGQLQQLVFAALVNLREEVFTLGEILLLDCDDRDIPTTRKPSKWLISIEQVDSLDEAVALSLKTIAENEDG